LEDHRDKNSMIPPAIEGNTFRKFILLCYRLGEALNLASLDPFPVIKTEFVS
jgi:hypothetical protein